MLRYMTHEEELQAAVIAGYGAKKKKKDGSPNGANKVLHIYVKQQTKLSLHYCGCCLDFFAAPYGQLDRTMKRSKAVIIQSTEGVNLSLTLRGKGANCQRPLLIKRHTQNED